MDAAELRSIATCCRLRNSLRGSHAAPRARMQSRVKLKGLCNAKASASLSDRFAWSRRLARRCSLHQASLRWNHAARPARVYKCGHDMTEAQLSSVEPRRTTSWRCNKRILWQRFLNTFQRKRTKKVSKLVKKSCSHDYGSGGSRTKTNFLKQHQRAVGRPRPRKYRQRFLNTFQRKRTKKSK